MLVQPRSIDDLLKQINPTVDLAYQEKMVHPFPDTEVIDRISFILHKCTDKIVMDIGCGGPLHGQILKVAKRAYGIDRVKTEYPDVVQTDISQGVLAPLIPPDVELILCCEIVEHLSNPGIFLDSLKQFEAEKLFSVPNAFGKTQPHWIIKGKENVNSEHVAWYSWYTFQNLLKRHGYKIKDFYWYDNPDSIQQHGLNEGLVFVTI